jgi:hypothetical protein
VGPSADEAMTRTSGTGVDVAASVADLERLHIKCLMPCVFQRWWSPRRHGERAGDVGAPWTRVWARRFRLAVVNLKVAALGAGVRRRLAGDGDLRRRRSATR